MLIYSDFGAMGPRALTGRAVACTVWLFTISDGNTDGSLAPAAAQRARAISSGLIRLRQSQAALGHLVSVMAVIGGMLVEKLFRSRASEISINGRGANATSI